LSYKHVVATVYKIHQNRETEFVLSIEGVDIVAFLIDIANTVLIQVFNLRVKIIQNYKVPMSIHFSTEIEKR
jgi:hypothetical protein